VAFMSQRWAELHGDEGEVYIDEVGGGDDDNDGSDHVGRRTRRQIERDEIRALQSQTAGL